jgi:TPR repeat protein
MIPEAMMKLAVEGDADAQYKVGIAYCLGHDVEIDYAEAADWFGRAVAQGHLPAKRELGIMHLTGDGVGTDPERAYAYLSEAAQAMDPNAMYHLALMYEQGVGTEPDLYEAIKLLAYAAGVGYPGAEMEAERVNDIITEERVRALKSRPLLNLEVSDVDVMAACCQPMFDDMVNETVVLMDTFGGPQLIGEDEEGCDLVLEKCPHCGKPVRRVPRDKVY